jgi:hypothetical protein
MSEWTLFSQWSTSVTDARAAPQVGEQIDAVRSQRCRCRIPRREYITKAHRDCSSEWNRDGVANLAGDGGLGSNPTVRQREALDEGAS